MEIKRSFTVHASDAIFGPTGTMPMLASGYLNPETEVANPTKATMSPITEATIVRRNRKRLAEPLVFDSLQALKASFAEDVDVYILGVVDYKHVPLGVF